MFWFCRVSRTCAYFRKTFHINIFRISRFSQMARYVVCSSFSGTWNMETNNLEQWGNCIIRSNDFLKFSFMFNILSNIRFCNSFLFLFTLHIINEWKVRSILKYKCSVENIEHPRNYFQIKIVLYQWMNLNESQWIRV